MPGFREMADSQCGETLCSPDFQDDPDFTPLPGFTPAKAMVFASIFPTDGQVCVRVFASVRLLERVASSSVTTLCFQRERQITHTRVCVRRPLFRHRAPAHHAST